MDFRQGKKEKVNGGVFAVKSKKLKQTLSHTKNPKVNGMKEAEVCRIDKENDELA